MQLAPFETNLLQSLTQSDGRWSWAKLEGWFTDNKVVEVHDLDSDQQERNLTRALFGFLSNLNKKLEATFKRDVLQWSKTERYCRLLVGLRLN